MSDTTTDLSVEDRIGLYFRQPNALYRESPHDLLRLAMYELGNKDRRIESLQRERDEAIANYTRDVPDFTRRIESLERENAALRDVLDRRGNLSKYVDSGNLLAEQKAPAITPETRERIRRAELDAKEHLENGVWGVKDTISDLRWNRKSTAMIRNVLGPILRDLLGEQG